MNDFIFPKFEDNPVSTRTYVAVSNIDINIEVLFDKIPVTPYIIVPKRRGRKTKVEFDNPNEHILPGSIITLERCESIKGVDLKKKKEKAIKKRNDKIAEGEQIPKKTSNYFRNSVTVVMILKDKMINFKVMRSGKFQMTGCKHEKQALQCVRYMMGYIKECKSMYKMKRPTDKYIQAIFVPAMRNIDFSVGFLIDRQKLDMYFNTRTDYISILEMSEGYTGVNIKIPLTMSLDNIVLTKLTLRSDRWWKGKIPYSEYFKLLDEKDQKKESKKKRRNTFLAFHSGRIIMSGMVIDTMRDDYYRFLDIIKKCKNDIVECLICDSDDITEMQVALRDGGFLKESYETDEHTLRSNCLEFLGEHY